MKKPSVRAGFLCSAALMTGLSVPMMPDATFADATATATATVTPTAIPRTCDLGGSSLQISSGLVVLSLPLSGSQVWRIGYLHPNNTRDLLIPPLSSHFNCSSTAFSGLRAKVCARLDPDTPAVGTIDCGGGAPTGYDNLLQMDHNTNQAMVGGQPNSGLPFDPGCTNTFIDPTGAVLFSCLEGTDSACTGPSHTDPGVCNSPTEQTLSGAPLAGGFILHAAIDVSLQFEADCSTPCPADNTPLQDGELQITGVLASGHTKGIVWNANNTALIFGTIGAGNGANNCGHAAGGPACLSEATGQGFPNCIASVPASLNNAAMVIAYPAVQFDPTIGDVIATLQLQCLTTPTSTPTSTPTPTPPPTPTSLGGCVATPQAGCHAPQRYSGISLNAASPRVGWRWLGGTTPVALSQFGDPVNGSTDYHLCIYDTNAGSPSLVFGARVPAGGTCRSRPCWQQIRNRVAYTNGDADPDGVRTMTLQASGRTEAYIAVHGRGSNLRMPVSADGISLLRESPEVTVQVQRSDSPNCWETVFTTPANHARRGLFVDSTR